MSTIDSCLRQAPVYSNSGKVRDDANQLLSFVPTLRPQVSPYTHENGRTSNLIQLVGTIPIYYAGHQYNIPVTVWLTEFYPYHPPISYVTPTPNMVIKDNHRHVDKSGRCYLPYVTQWNATSSNLYELVNHLSSIFSSEPPLFDKCAVPSPSAAPARPAPPPPQPQPQPPASQPPRFGPAQPPAVPVPYPSYTVPPPVPLPAPVTLPPSPIAIQPPAPVKTEDPEVVLRRNFTNRVKSRLQELSQQLSAEMSATMEDQNMFEARGVDIVNQIEATKREKEQAERNVVVLREKDQQLKQWLDENEAREVDIDTAISGKDVIDKQKLELMAEDRAIDDVLYTLDKALQNEKINLEMYIKNVRSLAREQFLKKALVRKIVEMKK